MAIDFETMWADLKARDAQEQLNFTHYQKKKENVLKRNL